MSAGEKSTVVQKYGPPGIYPEARSSFHFAEFLVPRQAAVPPPELTTQPSGSKSYDTELAGASNTQYIKITLKLMEPHFIQTRSDSHCLVTCFCRDFTPGKRMFIVQRVCRSPRNNCTSLRCGCERPSSTRVMVFGLPPVLPLFGGTTKRKQKASEHQCAQALHLSPTFAKPRSPCFLKRCASNSESICML